MADIISTPPEPGSGLTIGPTGQQQILTNCCDKALIPDILNAYVEMKGPFSCVTGKYSLFYLPSFNEWDGYDRCEGCKNAAIWMSLKCNWPGNNWTLYLKIVVAKPRRLTPTMTLKNESCDPLKLIFTGLLFKAFPITVTIQTPSAPSPLSA